MSHVYVAAASGLTGLKIGYSSNLDERRKAISQCVGQPVEFVAVHPHGDAAAVEAMAHWLLREHQAHGEWFSVTVEQASAAIMDAAERVRLGESAPRKATGRNLLRDEIKDVRVGLDLPETEIEALDEWRAKERIWSRSEAIRRLIADGLKRPAPKP